VARAKLRERTTDDARQIVRERFGNPWDSFTMDAACFHRVLPTPELRAAYIVEFPAEYLSLCGFCHDTLSKAFNLVTGPCMVYSDEESKDGCFRRWDIEAFLKRYAPQPFELPDLPDHLPKGKRTYLQSQADCAALYHDLQLERAKWWIASRLPVTPGEISFVRTYVPELLIAAGECKPDTWEFEHMPDGFLYNDVRWRDWPTKSDPEPSPEQPGPRLVVQ
jgi:hypothetical protein